MALNKNIPEEVGVLDLLNVFSLWAQMDNMNMDEKQTKYVRKVIQAISEEIQKLHKENDTIMQQNDLIADMIYGFNFHNNWDMISNTYKKYKKLRE